MSYSLYHKNSKPYINSAILDEEDNKQIARMLEMINNENNVTDKQLKIIENAIKNRLSKTNTLKQQYYLTGDNSKPKTQRISFSSSTKLGGKTRKSKKSKKSRRNKHSRY